MRYEHRHENLSERAGSDGHFSMLRRFVAVLVQKLSVFRKFWHFMIKMSKMISIAAIDLPFFFSHASFSQKNTYKPDLCNEISVFFLILVFSTTGSWTYNQIQPHKRLQPRFLSRVNSSTEKLQYCFDFFISWCYFSLSNNPSY